MTASQKGWVFNIQRYSLHDGPGIRTIVFLKGCPLSCTWCSNPESQKFTPELCYNASKCISVRECGFCIKACPTKAVTHNIKTGLVMVDRNKCTECLACAEACPSKSLDIFGELKSVADIMKVVETDSVFYARSGGGLTLGGGEPLSQGDFALSILKEAKLRRVNTSIETCGQTSWETLENCAKYLDTILYDIKCIDSKKHEKFTGVSNELILENFEKLCAAFPNTPKVVRTPVVPGFNDTQDDITQIMEFIKGKLGVKFEILPYHRMGQAKYEFLGREYPMAGVQPRDEKIAALKKMTQNWFAAN